MSKPKLPVLPCPFCGGDPVAEYRRGDERNGYSDTAVIRCNCCDVERGASGKQKKRGYGYADNSGIEARAVDAWNQRKSVPQGYALIGIDALKAWGKYEEVRNACRVLMTPQASVVQQQPCGVLKPDEFAGHVFVPRIAGDWSMLGKNLYTNPAQQAKPQPLTQEQREAVFTAANSILENGCPMSWEHAVIDAVEAAYGITKGPQ